MQLAATTYESPQSTTTIAISVAVALTVLLGLRFLFAYRNNRRLAERMGGMTETESQLARAHGVLIMALLVISMGLGVGAFVSPTVRDALSDVGENSRWIPTALIPVVLLYGRWLRKRAQRAWRERAALQH